MQNTLKFVVLGAVGAILYILVWSKNFRDLVKYESFRHIAVGALAGYIYSILYSEYSFPDSVMATVVGYFGPDFVEALFEKLKKI
ncbi:MAG: hypothetical protein QW584_04015 [Thermofilaceae archaeon]